LDVSCNRKASQSTGKAVVVIWLALRFELGSQLIPQGDQLIEALDDLGHRILSRALGVLIAELDQDVGEPTDCPHRLGGRIIPRW
jgi:hypothetical protein